MLYLSVPYSSSLPEVRLRRVCQARQAMARLMAEGRIVICPIAMNHEAIEILADIVADPGGAYWRALEEKLAGACDELVVLRLSGWEESRGVAREIELFESMDKPVVFLDPAGVGLAEADVSALCGPNVSESIK